MTESNGLRQGVVSVVIPTYDRGIRMLGAAVESVLAQDVPELELIVVDDGSAEPAAPMLAQFQEQVRVHRQDNGGIGSARNAGVKLAQGEFLAFLDSDDVWVAEKLTTQLAALSADPELEAVFGRAEQFHDEELDESERTRHPIKDRFLDAYLSAAMLIRRTSFDRVGPFNETTGSGIDLDWMLRSKEAGLHSLMLPDVVYRRRVHTTNTSITNERANKDRLLALKRSIDRRRAAERAPESNG